MPIEAARARLVTPVAMTVLLAWLVSLGYAVVAGDPVPLTVITPVMLLLAGYAFGVSITKRSDGE